jgi:hypothetical protein
MRGFCLAILLLSLCGRAAAEDVVQFVVVADPFVELHTGPGSGYPITQIIERGEEVAILKRRTDWFKIRGPAGREGWASLEQMELTLQPSGKQTSFPSAGRAAFDARSWEWGVMAGDFGGATSYAGFGSYRFSPHLAIELNASQILGNFSDGWGISANIVHTFMPKWRASPYFSLGTGMIHIEPKAALAQTPDRDDQTAIVGVGISSYVSRRFIFRVEYKSYVVLSSRNENEDVEEWKAGFAVFF